MSRREIISWGLAGLGLCGAFIYLALISPEFAFELKPTGTSIISLCLLMMAAGVLYLLLVWSGRRASFPRGLMAWVLFLGLVMRLVMFLSTPMLEDDHFRYLWDGGVLANGYNPYAFSPQAVREGSDPKIPAALRQMAQEASPIPERINYPWLRTIYPPICQGAFALAHLLKPWSLQAWRLVLLGADIISLVLLLGLLKRLNLSPLGMVIYWWNPLLIKEIYNSGHMELILFPFILGALHTALSRRLISASALLGLAVGVKFWPALLLPLILRQDLTRPLRLIPPLLAFGGVALAVLYPMYAAGLGESSGFTAYAKIWEMNDSLFMGLHWLSRTTLAFLGAGHLPAHLGARLLWGALVLAVALWLLRRPAQDFPQMCRRMLALTGALFLLSPTQFPWYALWLLPFLSLQPRLSLLLLSALLPLYYLRFYMGDLGLVDLFDNWLVFIQFAPVWGLLIWEAIQGNSLSLGAPNGDGLNA